MTFDPGRRELMKAAAAGVAAGALGSLGGGSAQAEAGRAKPAVKVAGYDYDRVRAIMDGRAGIPDRDVVFEYADIYAVNRAAFGPAPKYDVTELGLIPFVTKFLNEEFRAYTLVTAITPTAFIDGNPKIRRLFPDVRAAERKYFEKTRVFPIMHAVGVRAAAIEADPGLPKAVFDMYSQAKQLAYRDLETTTSLKVTLPWVKQEFEDTRRLMGDDYWPYGVAPNRKELDLVMRYTREQGLTKRLGKLEELFHPSTLALVEK